MLDRSKATHRALVRSFFALAAPVLVATVHGSAVAQNAGRRPEASAVPASSSAPAAPASASAATAMPSTTESAPEQVVWLTSGAILRGQIVELVPGKQVTLQLATGDIRTIPWAEIARSSFISPAPSPATSSSASKPAAPASSGAAPVETPPSAGGVHIEVIADRPNLWLESRRRFTEEPWTVACRAPCNQTLSVSDKSLRISGAGVRPSNSFFIEGRGGHEVLVARTGDAETHRWGQRALVSGIALGLAGGAAYGLGKVQDSDAAAVGGLVSMITSGALIAVALPLLGFSNTTVRNSKGDRVGKAGPSLVW